MGPRLFPALIMRIAEAFRGRRKESVGDLIEQRKRSDPPEEAMPCSRPPCSHSVPNRCDSQIMTLLPTLVGVLRPLPGRIDSGAALLVLASLELPF